MSKASVIATLHRIREVELMSVEQSLAAARAHLAACDLDVEAARQRLARFDASLAEEMRGGVSIGRLQLAHGQRAILTTAIATAMSHQAEAQRRVDAATQEVAAKRIAMDRQTRQVEDLRTQARRDAAKRRQRELDDRTASAHASK